MKDYKRLTKRCGDIVNYAKPLQSNFIGAIYEEQKERDSEIMSRLAELEDKIERGELISTKETGDTEIEFFVKHNDRVRKFALKNFAKVLKEKEQSVKIGNKWKAVVTDEDIDEFVKEVCGDD